MRALSPVIRICVGSCGIAIYFAASSSCCRLTWAVKSSRRGSPIVLLPLPKPFLPLIGRRDRENLCQFHGRKAYTTA